jgi:uncharacterized damage-inducible protein DinB
MIDIAYIQTMARYNRWQNGSLYGAANTLTDEARRADRGAFFRSIHGTFSHLLWADAMWMHRFAGTPKPDVAIGQSADYVTGWDDLQARRAALDEVIIDWTKTVDPAWLVGGITWFSGAVNRELSRPVDGLVVHFFNHQTHHRGQIHAMLTAAGAKPDATDLILLPAET